MQTITIVRGDPLAAQVELLIPNAIQRIHTGLRPGPILRAMGRGERVRVTLDDGMEAVMFLTHLHPPPEPEPSRQMAIALPRYRAAELYEVEVKLFFSVDATVFCPAADAEIASLIVDKVLQGERPPPSDLRMKMDVEDIGETLDRVERAIRHGRPQDLPLASHVVTRSVAVDNNAVPF